MRVSDIARCSLRRHVWLHGLYEYIMLSVYLCVDSGRTLPTPLSIHSRSTAAQINVLSFGIPLTMRWELTGNIWCSLFIKYQCCWLPGKSHKCRLPNDVLCAECNAEPTHLHCLVVKTLCAIHLLMNGTAKCHLTSWHHAEVDSCVKLKIYILTICCLINRRQYHRGSVNSSG